MFGFSAANYSLKLHKRYSIEAAVHGIRLFTRHYIIRYLSARELVLPLLLLYLVQELETVTFEIQRQYSSLFGRLKADQRKVCELQRSGTAPSHLPDVMHMTLSPRPSPSIFAYCKRSKTGGRTAWEHCKLDLCGVSFPLKLNYSNISKLGTF